MKDKSVPYVSARDTADYFDLKLTPKSFMNPANLQIFFENYKAQNYAPILKRFAIKNIDEIHAFKGYFDLIVNEQVLLADISGSYSQQAFSKLVLKAMNDSFSVIQKQVPFEVTSRYLAAFIEVAKHDCNFYISQAVEDPAKVTTICGLYNFASLDDVKTFLHPMYFNDTVSRQALMNATKMNDTEVTLLYNPLLPTSFGQAALNQTQFIHDYYGCTAVKTQCTDIEIAAMQWGSSAITLNIYSPYKETSFLNHGGASVRDIWGIGASEPEYYYYSYNYLSGN